MSCRFVRLYITEINVNLSYVSLTACVASLLPFLKYGFSFSSRSRCGPPLNTSDSGLGFVILFLS